VSPLPNNVPDVEAAVAAVAAQCLPGAAFDPDAPFALLGMDSLRTIEMAAALEESLGCELPPELLLECIDGRSLAARIVQIAARGPGTGRDDPFEQMLADAVLPEDVRPQRRTAVPIDLRRAKRILLTGATGFLGRALLKELSATTGAEIICGVRPGSYPGHTLVEPRSDCGRTPLFADLSHPRLGLSQEKFERLATHVDAVLHCGAAVNWVYPYSALRATNVLGTLELLRLACLQGIPFHFISSLSVCYSTCGPRSVDERFDPLPYLRGLKLGYAQTKAVAEALVRQAGARGLPVRIYRPALISGESAGGAYNRDDLISALVRGCVRMGSAPDLDWKLDCLPVDFVARAIVCLSGQRRRMLHIGHPRPRHWRECVLWMRMYGYPIRLLPHHAWLRQLDRETAPSAPGAADHPLRPLRAFFLDPHHDAHGLTLPELYEEGRRALACCEGTTVRLRRGGVAAPPLDAALLETYFSAFRRNGDLPEPPSGSPSTRERRASLEFTPEWLEQVLGRGVTAVRLLGSGSDHSIVSELTAWRSRQPTGLFHVHADLDDGSSLDLRVKVKAADVDAIAVGGAVAELVDADVGTAYGRWGHRLGLAAAHLREVEIYRQTDERFTRHAPALHGSLIDGSTGTWIAALESITNARHLDAADRDPGWTATDLRAAIDGLAALHAIWVGRETELRAEPWIGYVQTSAGMAEMSDLWEALAYHAAPAFSSWAHPDITTLQRRLISSIPRWSPCLEAGPRTLIHNDFNPRNACLRRRGAQAPRGLRLCAYDWELATIGAPQRDLAEFLCFVLPDQVGQEEVQYWIDRHREALERQTGRLLEPEMWQRGFRAGLYEFLINRLAVYALVHRIRRQPFLPKVVRTWRRIYEHLPLEEAEC
jgi:thioester reductase-like protein